MNTLFKIFESVIADSRIDFPQETLSSDVWTKNKNGCYILKEDVKKIILDAIAEIEKNPSFNIIHNARIVGSICSNQYTVASDIDIHFIMKTVPNNMKTDEINGALSKYILSNKKLNGLFISTHPVQFYFQMNEYQDLMSAGVYDIKNDEWIIGPSEVDLDFNPYEEFVDAFPVVGEYIKKIEDILNTISCLIHDSPDKIDKIKKELDSLIAIKHELKEYRRSFSAPTNKEEAALYREDKEWQKIDAVFKFIDKFGYLRKITKIENLIKKEKIINKSILDDIKGIML